MFDRLGKFVSRHWLAIIIAWILLVGLLIWKSPRWFDVTQDGDLAFLPSTMPSVVGEQLQFKAFPNQRSKSQIAFIVAQEDAPILEGDTVAVAYDVARRVQNLHGAAAIKRGRQAVKAAAEWREKGNAEEADQAAARARADFAEAETALEDAARFDTLLAKASGGRPEADEDEKSRVQPSSRLAELYYNQSLLFQELDRMDEAIAAREIAEDLDRRVLEAGEQLVPAGGADLPIVEVWTWLDEGVGDKLGAKHKHARVVLMNLSVEFMATQNIDILDYLDRELAKVKEVIRPEFRDQVKVTFTGSAAIGGDMLRAAKESIENTELFTVVFVIVILSLIYRSPLLVVLPLVVIWVSLTTGTSVVALLTQVNKLPGFAWWNFQVFTTTKVFIVAVLYGAGTDFFLFLVARYREELEHGYSYPDAVARALSAVGDALTASAMTVIMGLSMMFFADFGKFTHSGPAIALCLLMTLAACLTLAPAMLRAAGPLVLWPFGVKPRLAAPPERAGERPGASRPDGLTRFWELAARAIMARPGMILVVSILLMSPLAVIGTHSDTNVSYDLLKQLPEVRPSRQGAELMARYFPIGETGPLTVLVQQSNAHFETKEGRDLLDGLRQALFVDGVDAVRCVTDPLGDLPPPQAAGAEEAPPVRKGKSRSGRSLRQRVASARPQVVAMFLATEGQFAGKVARFDLLLKYPPFSDEAAQVLEKVEAKLNDMSRDPQSPWHGATFAYAGITAGTRDLKVVTQSDNRRIQRLTVLAVLAVLLVILRRPLICLYMILSVLFSYYVTIGATEVFFEWLRGADYVGLDWKVPCFLFVILVAIGQDYNVYLATRVFEEQEKHGRREGLRRAIVRTGGIITSCGVIMAGTFATMTSGAWGPTVGEWCPPLARFFAGQGAALEAMLQMGFALSLGVMLDTFVVRPVLLPAFLALLCRERKRASPPVEQLAPPAMIKPPARATVRQG